MLHIIKNLCVPRVILRYIMMNYLDLTSIKTIILNIKEMNVLDNFSKTILSNAKHGLVWNCKNGNLSTVHYLVSVSADIHAYNDYAIINASKNGHLSTVQYLVSIGADIHAHNDYAIINASKNGHLSTVQYLVELGNSHRLSPNSTCRYSDKVELENSNRLSPNS